MLNPEANAVVLRKVGNTLRTSVYEQIGWACDVLGVAHLFDFGLSPMDGDGSRPTRARSYALWDATSRRS